MSYLSIQRWLIMGEITMNFAFSLVVMAYNKLNIAPQPLKSREMHLAQASTIHMLVLAHEKQSYLLVNSLALVSRQSVCCKRKATRRYGLRAGF